MSSWTFFVDDTRVLNTVCLLCARTMIGKKSIDSRVYACVRGSIFHGRFVYTVGTYRHATFTRDELPIHAVDKDATGQRMDNKANKKITKKITQN